MVWDGLLYVPPFPYSTDLVVCSHSPRGTNMSDYKYVVLQKT